MKNTFKIQLISALLLIAMLLTGCKDSGATTPTTPPHEHVWADATCTAAKTCTSCGKTEGEPLAHDWEEATYYAPQTCKVCGATEGDVLESPIPDHLNLALQIDKLPVATADMTEDELRDVIVKFMYLQLNFAFTPEYSGRAESYSYYIKNLYSAYNGKSNLENLRVKYDEGKYYGGVPYMGNSAGSLYRWLEFYDPITGAMDWDPILRTKRGWTDSGISYSDVGSPYFGNTCASSCVWAFMRVTNKIDTFWTNTWIPANGFVKVGDYDLSADEDHGSSTKSLCSKNGKKKMFAAYAKIQKADGLVQTGHAVMSLSDAVVVYGADGNIDGDASYILVAEQKASFLTASPDKGGVDLYSPMGDKGLTYRITGNYAGNVVNDQVKEMKWTFNDLYSKGFLPFTLPELAGTDPVDKAEVTLNLSGKPYTAEEIKASELKNMTVKSNYAISDLHFTIRDKDGKQVFTAMYAKPASDTVSLKVYSVSSALTSNALYQNKGIININVCEYAALGTYTLEITARVSTGELLTVFNGLLTE